MSRYAAFFVLAMLACAAAAPTPPPPTPTQSPTPAGVLSSGTFTNDDDGSLTATTSGGTGSYLEIFVATVENAATVQIRASNSPNMPEGYTLLGDGVYIYSSAGSPYQFGVDPRLTLTVPAGDLNNVREDEVAMWYYTSEITGWRVAPNTWYDAEAGTVRGSIPTSGHVAVFEGEVPAGSNNGVPEQGTPGGSGSNKVIGTGLMALIIVGGLICIIIGALIYRSRASAGGGAVSMGAVSKPAKEPKIKEPKVKKEPKIKEPKAPKEPKAKKEKPLPAGWAEFETEDGTAVYYHNETTGETVWERP